jgi:hypothetical protein
VVEVLEVLKEVIRENSLEYNLDQSFNTKLKNKKRFIFYPPKIETNIRIPTDSETMNYY